MRCMVDVRLSILHFSVRRTFNSELVRVRMKGIDAIGLCLESLA